MLQSIHSSRDSRPGFCLFEMSLSANSNANLNATLEFDTPSFNLSDPANVTINYRASTGEGLFLPQITTYNPVIGKLSATLQLLSQGNDYELKQLIAVRRQFRNPRLPCVRTCRRVADNYHLGARCRSCLISSSAFTLDSVRPHGRNTSAGSTMHSSGSRFMPCSTARRFQIDFRAGYLRV